jgi:signal transduction histidine kinase
MEGDAAREAGGILLEEIDRLDEMARTFSQFGRMPEGPSSQVDLVELLEGLVKQHGGEGTGERTATIHFQIENGLMVPRVEGHFDALLRVFRNLLLNAVDAAGPNGEVSVSAGGTLELAKVQIRDSGPGIAQEDLDRIWDPEFTTKSQGTGLGLPLVKQTVLFHHGRVDGRNHPEGGAVFVVELPKEGVLAKE